MVEGHKEKPNSVCVNHRAQGDGGGEEDRVKKRGEEKRRKERRGEWESE